MSKSTYKGVDIREVWDFRLSTGCPYLFNSGETWVIKIIANDGSGVLEEIVTDIPTGDIIEGQQKCYPILRDIRDKYSRPNIDELKEPVAAINAENQRLAGGAA